MTILGALLWWVLGAVCGLLLLGWYAPRRVAELQRELHDVAEERAEINRQLEAEYDRIERDHEEWREAWQRTVGDLGEYEPEIEPEDFQAAQELDGVIRRTRTAYYDCMGCGSHVMIWAHPVVDLEHSTLTCAACGHPVAAQHEDLTEENAALTARAAEGSP